MAPAAPPAWVLPAYGAAPMMLRGVWPALGVDFGPPELPLAVLVIALLSRWLQLVVDFLSFLNFGVFFIFSIVLMFFF